MVESEPHKCSYNNNIYFNNNTNNKKYTMNNKFEKYKIDITIKDFTYYLMDLSRRTQTPYNSTDVKNSTKPTYTHIRLELGKYLLPELLATEKCWTSDDVNFILNNYQQEDFFDDNGKLLGIRYKYIARFFKAFEDFLDDNNEEKNEE